MFDFAECFARSARLVVPRAAERGLAFTFDMDVPTLPVEGEWLEAERSLHRLLLGACGLLDTGLLAIHGSLDDDGYPSVRLTGVGSLVSGELLVRALEGLAVRPSCVDQGTHLKAQGNCPVSGAPVILVHDAASGFELRATLPYEPTQADVPRPPSANAAVVWVCLPTYPAPGVFVSRLERLGWTVVLFELATAVDDALGRLVYEQPALLLGQFLTPSAEHGMMCWLGLPVSAQVPRVLGVPLGHSALAQRNSAVQVHAMPFSPLDLARLTAAQEPEFDAGTLPQGLAPRTERPLLLVVDDNLVNQAVLCAMGQAMGYSVLQAWNGQDAVDLCKSTPPAAVLMDVNMPVMDGLEATRQVRALQRCGDIGPFPILGASADATRGNEAACLEAGMDLFLTKPLAVADVAAQFRRLGLEAPLPTAR